MPHLYLTEKSSALAALKKSGLVEPGALSHAAAGHLLNTVYPGDIKPEWSGFDPAILPILVDRIPLVPAKSRDGKSYKDRLAGIVADMKRSDCIVIATDAGREGSLIGWEILVEAAKLGRDLSKIKRLHLTAQTDTGIKAAFDRMNSNANNAVEDYAAYQEGRMRQLEDWMFGMNGSILLNSFVKPSGIRTPWGYGPVQLGLLALLYDREIQIRDFVPEEYFLIRADFVTDHGTVTLTHYHRNPLLKDAVLADAIVRQASNWTGPLSVRKRDARRGPPALFSGNSLAKIAAKAFGWKPVYTESVNQKLYERGLLTYPRTESNKLPEDQAPMTPAVLNAIGRSLPHLAALIPERPVIRPKTHYVADPGEHHAIVPTDESDPNLSGDELKLYERIARGYLAAHLPDIVLAETKIEARIAGIPDTLASSDQTFSAKGQVEIDPGWRVALHLEKNAETLSGKKDTDEETTTLPPIPDRARATTSNAFADPKMTTPEKRITLGGLGEFASSLSEFIEDPALKAALIDPAKPDEPRGLGTIASLKGIIPNLFQRNWVEERGRNKDPALAVTGIGIALIEYLREHYPRHAFAVQRALFERRLQNIGRARTVVDCDRAVAGFIEATKAAVLEMIEALMNKPPLVLDASLIPDSKPTDNMISVVRSTADRLQIPIPPGALTTYEEAKAFLDQHVSNPKPSEKQIRLAKDLATRLGETVPDTHLEDRTLLQPWIDEALTRAPERLASKKQIAVLAKAISEGKINAEAITGYPDNVAMSVASRMLDSLFGDTGKRGASQKSPNRKMGRKMGQNSSARMFAGGKPGRAGKS